MGEPERVGARFSAHNETELTLVTVASPRCPLVGLLERRVVNKSIGDTQLSP